MLVGSAEVVVRPHFILIGLSSDAFSSIPLIAGHSDSKDVVVRELLLPQIGRQAQFVLFSINEVVQIGFYEGSLLDGVAVSLWMKHLPDLVVDWVLLYFSEPEVSWIHWPVIGALFLLPRIVVLVRFQIELPHFLWLRHVFP